MIVGNIIGGSPGNGTGGIPHINLTNAKYDALTEEEKNADVVYFITDAGGGSSNDTNIVISNPNELINSDFRLWSNGDSFSNISASTYTADCWRNTKSNNQNLSVEKNINGMKLTTTDTRSVITQVVKGRLLGEDYTISLSVDGIKLESATFNASDTTWLSKELYYNDKKIAMVSFQVQTESSGTTHIEIYIYKPSAVINWVKLERGKIATPFISRSLVEERLLSTAHGSTS